jgi:hypothetical protein
MIESSSGGRPVPSINVPPLTTIAFSAIFSSEFTSIIYLLSSLLRNQELSYRLPPIEYSCRDVADN